MTPERKEYIDTLSVYDLLSANRFAPIGDSCFQGEEGIYRGKRLAELRSKDAAAYVAASKAIGH